MQPYGILAIPLTDPYKASPPYFIWTASVLLDQHAPTATSTFLTFVFEVCSGANVQKVKENQLLAQIYNSMGFLQEP